MSWYFISNRNSFLSKERKFPYQQLYENYILLYLYNFFTTVQRNHKATARKRKHFSATVQLTFKCHSVSKQKFDKKTHSVQTN